MLTEWRVSQRGVGNERSWWALVNCHLPQGIPLKCGFNRAKWEAAELPGKAGTKFLLANTCQSQSSFWKEDHQHPAQEWLPESSLHEWRWKKLTSSEVPRGPASTTISVSHPLFWRKISYQQCQKFKRRGKCGFWDNAVAWLTDRLTRADNLRSPLSLRRSSLLSVTSTISSAQHLSLLRQKHRKVSAQDPSTLRLSPIHL